MELHRRIIQLLAAGQAIGRYDRDIAIDVEHGAEAVFAGLLTRQAGAAAADHLAVDAVAGAAGLLLLVVTVVAFGTIPAGIGIPLLVLTVSLTRRLADAHRRRAAAVLGRPVPSPYAPRANSAPARFVRIFRDPATWRDLLWLPADFALSQALFGAAVTAPIYGVHFLLAPLERRLDRLADRLASLEKLRVSYNPDGPLRRGFARVERADGHLAASAASLDSGEAVQLVFADGRRGAVIDGAPNAAIDASVRRRASRVAAICWCSASEAGVPTVGGDAGVNHGFGIVAEGVERANGHERRRGEGGIVGGGNDGEGVREDDGLVAKGTEGGGVAVAGFEGGFAMVVVDHVDEHGRRRQEGLHAQPV